METVRALFKNIVFVSVLLLLFGGLLLFSPGEVLTTFVRIIGGVAIAGAAFWLTLELVAKNRPRSVPGIVLSAFVAVLGLVFLFAPSFVTAILPFLFGVILIVLSAFNLLSALEMPLGKLLSIILSALGILLGAVLVSNPNALAAIITRLVGVALIYEAVIGFIHAAFIKAAEKD